VILLEKSGFAAEAGPLMRSISEHTIRLAYASNAGFEAVEVGLRERAHGLEKFKKAQSWGGGRCLRSSWLILNGCRPKGVKTSDTWIRMHTFRTW
jgi:hypothetical protein